MYKRQLSRYVALPSFLSFLLLLSCTSQTSLRTASLLGFLLCPSILSRLRYPTLFQLALSLLSPIQAYQIWLETSFGMLLTYITISTFSRLYLFKVGTFPVLLLILYEVLLVVLEHPITFLAAAVCTASSCVINLASPSHASPACSSFGTITFIRTQILTLLSRCESVRIAHRSCLRVLCPCL